MCPWTKTVFIVYNIYLCFIEHFCKLDGILPVTELNKQLKIYVCVFLNCAYVSVMVTDFKKET